MFSLPKAVGIHDLCPLCTTHSGFQLKRVGGSPKKLSTVNVNIYVHVQYLVSPKDGSTLPNNYVDEQLC